MSESNGFEVVERPEPSRRYRRGLQAAILATAETGQAIRLDRSFSHPSAFAAAKAKGLRIRQQASADGHIFVWAEKING